MENQQQTDMNQVYGVVGQLTLQLWQSQETNKILQKQVSDLSEQLKVAQLQLQQKTETHPQFDGDLTPAQAIKVLQEKGVPVSIDNQNLPSMEQGGE